MRSHDQCGPSHKLTLLPSKCLTCTAAGKSGGLEARPWLALLSFWEVSGGVTGITRSFLITHLLQPSTAVQSGAPPRFPRTAHPRGAQRRERETVGNQVFIAGRREEHPALEHPALGPPVLRLRPLSGCPLDPRLPRRRTLRGAWRRRSCSRWGRPGAAVPGAGSARS